MLPGIPSFSASELLANNNNNNSEILSTTTMDNNNNNSSSFEYHASNMSKNTGLFPVSELDANRWQNTLSSLLVTTHNNHNTSTNISATSLRSVFTNTSLLPPFDHTQIPPAKPISVSMKEKKIWLEHRKTVAAFDHRNRTIKVFLENRVSIVCGSAGSGKSTYVPVQLHERSIGKKKRIIVVRPTVFGVADLAERLRAELSEPKETSHFVGDTSS